MSGVINFYNKCRLNTLMKETSFIKNIKFLNFSTFFILEFLLSKNKLKSSIQTCGLQLASNGIIISELSM